MCGLYPHIVSMPEAAVDKDGGAVGPQDDVGLARYALDVEPVAIAVTPEPAAHQQLGLGGLAADVRHAAVALFGCHAVGHGGVRFRI